MLFNSYAFIFLFLPIVAAISYLLGQYNSTKSKIWLCAASIFFYGSGNWKYTGLLIASILINFLASSIIAQKNKKRTDFKTNSTKPQSIVLHATILANLILLFYFKYTNFFISTSNEWLGTEFYLHAITLPLGISFFTFTQIAYLVDSHQGKVTHHSLINYFLLVTYFPHQIAGPLLHHKQMIPQFEKRSNWAPKPLNIAAGLTLFAIGLAKKVVIADHLAEYSDLVFNAVANGQSLMLLEAWVGALSYTLQLYFDFSGYSDMAIGLSLMFNIRLPINFNSPYKATSIIDFWRRWHITLSTFLKDYLYIPLGGNRHGTLARNLNLFVTMLLGGMWHGAGWSFIIWGGLHGVYLIINHGWRSLRTCLGWTNEHATGRFLARALTFLCVVLGWVFFRSDSLHGGLALLCSMAGLNGISLPTSVQGGELSALLTSTGLEVNFLGLLPITQTDSTEVLSSLILSLAIVWLLPNSCEFLAVSKPTYEATTTALSQQGKPLPSVIWLRWSPTLFHALIFGAMFACSILMIVKGSPFLYFRF